VASTRDCVGGRLQPGRDRQRTDTKLRSKPEHCWLSVEFQQLTDEIAAKADQKNLDGATLGYVQLAANCVRCHRHVRDVK
jgi:hypothetical protein